MTPPVGDPVLSANDRANVFIRFVPLDRGRRGRVLAGPGQRYPESEMTGSRRYSFDDAMRYLNASKRSLRRWVAEGDIDCLRIGARVYFLTEQLVAFQLKRGRFNKDPRRRQEIEASLAVHAEEFREPILRELAARIERLELQVFGRKEVAA